MNRTEKIILVRKLLNMDSGEMGRCCGYSPSAIRHLENGSRPVTDGYCDCLIKSADVRREWLMGDTHNKEKEPTTADKQNRNENPRVERKEKIKLVRTLLNADTGELQRETGYNQCSIRQMETGRLSVSDDYCAALVETVDVNGEWLKAKEKEPSTKDTPSVKEIFREYYEVDGVIYPRKALVPEFQAKRIREVFSASGLSQRDFCKETGWTLSNLNDMLNAKRKLSVRYAERLEKAFGVSVDWLLYGIKENYPLTAELEKWIKSNEELRK